MYLLSVIEPSGVAVRVLLSLFVRPSVLPSGSFRGIGSLVFPETQHVRGPCSVVRYRAGFFFKKTLLSQKSKMGKMNQK